MPSPGEGHQGRGPDPKLSAEGDREIAPPMAIVDPGGIVDPISAANDKVAFIEASQEHPAEVDRPEAILNFLEADVVLLERIGDEE